MKNFFMVALVALISALLVVPLGFSSAVWDVSCNTFQLNELGMTTPVFHEEVDDDRLSPGEEIRVEFSYNLPACSNSIDHGMHNFSFYSGGGEYLGSKLGFYSVTGNWNGYTSYSLEFTVPEFDTKNIAIEIQVRASSVHGSNVCLDNGDLGSCPEDTYDVVVRDTVNQNPDLKDLPLSDSIITMLKNTKKIGSKPCPTPDYTVSTNNYLENPEVPGIFIPESYSMNSGHDPCYIFSAYQHIKCQRNWYECIDYNGEGDNNINKASTCGPKTSRRHNGGGDIYYSTTFTKGCLLKSHSSGLGGDWISRDKDYLCASGNLKNANDYSEPDGIFKANISGNLTYFVSNGTQWLSHYKTDENRGVCKSFSKAEDTRGWITGTLLAENTSALRGARCCLSLTNDRFITKKEFCNSGDAFTCASGLEKYATVSGKTYYCRGFV